MTDIGTFFTELFRPLGLWGGLICIFVLFYIDAIVFPTVPELFTVLIYTSITTEYGLNPATYGIAILATIVVAEIAGVMTLYLVVKRAKLPRRLHKVVKRYQSFLLCPDERMILVNRIAPILPFLGAFVALAGWKLRRSLGYVVLGGLLKYGVILAMSGLFLTYFNQGTATTVTVIMVIIIIILSMVVSYYRKRRMDDACRAT